MKASIIFSFSAAVLILCSCGAGNGKKEPKPVEVVKPATVAEALRIAGSVRFSDIPDTVFLDYYLGMPKAGVDALTKWYLKSKKLRRTIYSDGTYHYTLNTGKNKLRAMVGFHCTCDTLSMVMLAFEELISYSNSNNAIFTLADFFEPIYHEKGYHCIYQGFDKESLEIAERGLKHVVMNIPNPVIDPIPCDLNNSTAINFFRGNTVIRILKEPGTCAPIIYIYDYYLLNRQKEAEEAQQAEERKKAQNDI